MGKERQFSKSNRGVAAIEFAILAPLVVLLLFGIIAYGIFFGAAHSVQQLAANSARAAMGGLDEEERQQLVDQYVATATADSGLIRKTYLDVELSTPEGLDDFLMVTVSYDATHLPMWNLYAGLPLPEKTITRKSVIRTGGY